MNPTLYKHISVSITAFIIICFTIPYSHSATNKKKKKYYPPVTATERKLIGTTFSGTAYIIDGDSLRITTSDHKKIEVRIHGIDATEMSSISGRQAKKFLIKSMPKNRWVRCTVKDVDHYGRWVSNCETQQFNIAQFMLKNHRAVVLTVRRRVPLPEGTTLPKIKENNVWYSYLNPLRWPALFYHLWQRLFLS